VLDSSSYAGEMFEKHKTIVVVKHRVGRVRFELRVIPQRRRFTAPILIGDRSIRVVAVAACWLNAIKMRGDYKNAQ
jgi:hypothetical protein